MVKKPLNDDDIAVRYVGKMKQNLDADGNPLGPSWAAFDLKDGEEYLSIDSRKNASPEDTKQLPIIKEELAKRNLSGKTAILTSGKVTDIKEAFLPDVVSLNCFDNKKKPSYSGLENMPLVNRRVYLKKLEKQYWNDWVKLGDV